jgi:hypothetical protein
MEGRRFKAGDLLTACCTSRLGAAAGIESGERIEREEEVIEDKRTGYLPLDMLPA